MQKWLSLLLVGCVSIEEPSIYMDSGSYALIGDEYPEDEYSEERSTFALDVDIEALTAVLTGVSTPSTLSLLKREVENETLCPTMFFAVTVQTYDVEESFDLFGKNHTAAYLYPNHCSDNEPITDVVLSTTIQEGDSEETVEYFLRKQE